jgi:TldD protein
VRTVLLACAMLACAQAQPALTGILAEELDRNFRILKEKGEPPPYYVAYAVTERETESVSASLGALVQEGRHHNRYLDVTLRVGSPQLDNYRSIRGDFPRFTSGAVISLEDNADAIRRRVWMETDRVYRLAAQRLINIRANKDVRLAGGDASDDFTIEEGARHAEEPARLRFDAGQWAARARKLSAEFARYPEILGSQVSVSAMRETKHRVDTAGARLTHGRLFARVMIGARAKAPDGMDLALNESFEGSDPSRLPKDEEILAAIRRLAGQLAAQVKAPLVEPFVGPAMLSGRAAGVFFHEIFGHRIEGHRQKDETEGQTFAKSLALPVLPDFLSVVFDPTLRSAAETDLNGAYQYDDEGVAARRVTVIDRGILKTFLMSRSPAAGVTRSNGHGRREPGAEIVARQSNLLVESARKVSDARLREMLIEEIKRQNKPYGYLFDQVVGGYTTTGRRGIQAFKVIPVLVYRVYSDGRPDEMVRGADIVGTPLASFSKIVATGDRLGVFNGYCGAESGDVPVSAVSPALLVTEIEIQKKESGQDRPPLLPPPSGAAL